MGFLFNRYRPKLSSPYRRYSRSVFSTPNFITIRWIISGIKVTDYQPIWKVCSFSFNWMHFPKGETRGGAVRSGIVLLAGGCEFDSRWGLWNFSHFSRTVALGSTQSVTAVSTSSIFWEQKWEVSEADNPVIFMCGNSGCLNFLQPSGNAQAYTGLL
jgi:hypothetical protein